MTIKSIWLRRIHKWVGLAIGLQFVIWAISGAAMALLDMRRLPEAPGLKRPKRQSLAKRPRGQGSSASWAAQKSRVCG